MTVADLKAKAKELGIKGADSMKKAELEKAIEVAKADELAAKVRGASSPAAPKSDSSDSPKQSSSCENDFQKHPKFHKFNAKGDSQP